MRVIALAAYLGLLAACATDEPQPSPSPVSALVWDAVAVVGDSGPGYPVGVRHFSGGPLQMLVDPAGRAYVSFAHASPEGPFSTGSVQGWGNVYEPNSGWKAPVLLAEGTGLTNHTACGIGFTPDGAMFGWRNVIDTDQAFGLRGFDVRLGWQSAGTLLAVPGPQATAAFTTTSDGTPTMAYEQGSDVFVVRHRGALEGPERVFARDHVWAVTADGTGVLALTTGSGKLALRLADGRWIFPPRANPASLAGLPKGGFCAAWAESSGGGLLYRAATLDIGGRLTPPADLGSAPAVPIDTRFGAYYNSSPRIASSASGNLAVAWRAGERLFVTRAMGDRWEPLQTVPNATTRLFGLYGFDVAIDASGRLLVAWVQDSLVKVAYQAPGQSWSSAVDLGRVDTVDPTEVLVATNASGTAFATWSDGRRVLAARSLVR